MPQTATLSSSIDASALGRADALLHLPTPVLVVGANGAIDMANDAAQALFAPDHTVGADLRALVAAHGASGGEALPAVLAGEVSTTIRIELSGGRVLDCTARPLADGAAALLLVDVSRYVREAESASYDALTGLLNRAGFQSRVREALARSRRDGDPLAVLCIDLDRFKSVNDSLGHPVGDALLAKVAERLRSIVREGDLVARLGGDEFAIIQVDNDQPQAAQGLAARLVDLIGRTYIVGGHMLNIGASIGVAIAPADGADADTLLKRADLALYRAKADGRNVARFFEPEMDARMQSRRLLELDLRRALALKEFELDYQPQIEVDQNTVVGFEALLRWRNPVRGLVAAADFIPLAEEIGLIVPIGEWVLRTACREAANWSRPASIAVNLSPVQFRNPKLVSSITSALTASKLDPTRLELEITERAMLEDTELVVGALHRIKALGVRVSMDDFGTGYSSLSYLQRFPFDKIKIDQSFVRDLDSGGDGGAIVRAVAGLGASLGVKTTAEGVETLEQLALIRAEGCSEVQGFLTGRPMNAAAAAALLRTTASDASNQRT